MKKKLLIAVASMVVMTVSAQRQETHFGIKAGVNLANLKIENGPEGDHRTGFHAGALAHIHLTGHFALQPELLFSAQGREHMIGGVNYRTNLSYINVPVIGQFMTGSGFRLQTGPQLGFLVDAESEAGNFETNVKESYKTIDVSWAFGAGYLTNSGLGIDARYNLGLTNINDASNTDITNRVWQLGLFYQFNQSNAHHKRK